ELVARPFTDHRARGVADVVLVEREQRAEPRVRERRARAGETIVVQAAEIDALLEVHLGTPRSLQRTIPAMLRVDVVRTCMVLLFRHPASSPDDSNYNLSRAEPDLRSRRRRGALGSRRDHRRRVPGPERTQTSARRRVRPSRLAGARPRYARARRRDPPRGAPPGHARRGNPALAGRGAALARADSRDRRPALSPQGTRQSTLLPVQHALRFDRASGARAPFLRSVQGHRDLVPAEAVQAGAGDLRARAPGQWTAGRANGVHRRRGGAHRRGGEGRHPHHPVREHGAVRARAARAGSQPLASFSTCGGSSFTFAAAARISFHVLSSTEMPSRSRFARVSRSGSPASRTRSAPGAGRPFRSHSTNWRVSLWNAAAVPRRAASITMVSMPFSTRCFLLSSKCQVPPPVSAPPSSSHATARP